MDGSCHENAGRQFEAQKTNYDFNTLEVSPICGTCRTLLEIYDSTDRGIIIESTELIEDRAFQGCQLCAYFVSRLRVDPERERRRATYRARRKRSATANNIDVSYRKTSAYDCSSSQSSMMIAEITLTGVYGQQDCNLWTRFLHNKNPKGLMKAEDFGLSSESEQSFALVRKWCLDCSNHHNMCRGAPNSPVFNPLPTRLLSIGEEFPTNLHLRHGCNLPRSTKYTTLSHCWGERGIVTKLSECNYLSMMEKVIFDDLPKTFRDAIVVSKMLGVEYLWIDSLCIIQDSPSDWQRESSLMSQIYSNSFCNISATAALDSSQGLFFARDPVTIREFIFQTCIDGTRGYFSPCDEGLWMKYVIEAPLNGRAWVCQERILSKRNLHFSRSQIFWECCEHLACETFPSGFSIQWGDMSLKQDISKFFFACSTKRVSGGLKLPPNDDTVNWAYQVWEKVVTTFCRGQLTYETDKLVAIGGLATLMNETLVDVYLAGLWKRHLITQLLWYSCDGYTQTKGPYVAPSWSWAAVRGNIVHTYVAPTDRSTALAEVTNVYTNSISGNEYGQLTGGCVILKGKLARLNLRRLPGVFASCEDPTGVIEGSNRSLDEKGLGGASGNSPLHRRFLQFHWDNKYCNLHEYLYLLPVYLQNVNVSEPSAEPDQLQGLILMPSGEEPGKLVERCGVFKAFDKESIQNMMEGCKHFDTIAETEGFEPIHHSNGGKNYWISIV